MRNPVFLSLALATLLGVAGARVPVDPGAMQATVTASSPMAAVAGTHLVLADAPATEVGADAFSEIVPPEAPQVDRQEEDRVASVSASGSARPAVALQRALAALGRRAHPPTAPPRSD
jgi:hypothetical protein